MRKSIYSCVVAFCMLLVMPFGAAMAETGFSMPSYSIEKTTDNVPNLVIKDAVADLGVVADNSITSTIGGGSSGYKSIGATCLNCLKPIAGVSGVASLTSIKRLSYQA